MGKYHTVIISKDSETKLATAINKCIEESDYKLVPPIQFSTEKAHIGLYYSALILFIK
jgi:hypothetical protein